MLHRFVGHRHAQRTQFVHDADCVTVSACRHRDGQGGSGVLTSVISLWEMVVLQKVEGTEK